MRANINFADKAVILGQNLEGSSEESNNFDEMIDAESIFIYKAIKKCNKNIQIMIELVYEQNIEYLLSQDNDMEFKFELTSLYAAGQVLYKSYTRFTFLAFWTLSLVSLTTTHTS